MKKLLLCVLFIITILSSRTALAFQFDIVPGISITEEYNDNIFLDSSNRVDDFITYVIPSVNVSMRSASTDLRIGYFTSFSFYTHNSDLNDDPAHNFIGSSQFRITDRLTLSLSDHYVRSTETGDIRAIPDVGPVSERRKLTYNNATGNISYQLRNNLTWSLGASYVYSKYEETESNETKTYSGNSSLHYTLSPRTTLSVNAAYHHYDYDTEHDGKGQDYALTLTYAINPTLTIDLTGGVSITKTEGDESHVDFTGGATISKRLQKGEIAAVYRQNVISGTETDSPVTSRTASLRGSRFLTSKLTASIGTSFGKYESVETHETDTEAITFNTSLSYSFRPWANISLSYEYVNSNDKTDDDDDYYNNRVLLVVNFTYGREARK